MCIAIAPFSNVAGVEHRVHCHELQPLRAINDIQSTAAVQMFMRGSRNNASNRWGWRYACFLIQGHSTKRAT